MKKILPFLSIILFCAVLSGCGKVTFSEPTDLYTAENIEHVEIRQKNSTGYELRVALAEGEKTEVKLYFTRFDILRDGDVPLDYTLHADGTYRMNVSAQKGDYFLFARYKKDGKAMETLLPVTIPHISPKIYWNGAVCNLLYEKNSETSWSSFVDPFGMCVYRGATNAFEDAQLLREKIEILESEYKDASATSAQPYYFMTMEAKGGKVRFVSSAIHSVMTQNTLSANWLTLTDGSIALRVTGTAYCVDEPSVERSVAVRVGQFDWSKENQGVKMFYNTRTLTPNLKEFTVDIKLSELPQIGATQQYNMDIYLTENNNTLEFPLSYKNDGVALTLGAQASYNGKTYATGCWEGGGMLQIHW